jgi:hypothetical protein
MKRFSKTVLDFILKKSTILIVLFDLIVQFAFIGKYLDNSVLSPYMPTALDSVEYVERAQIWQTDGVPQAFGDAYRMPGYPLIILVMSYIVPAAPYLGVRILQFVALAISVGMIKVVLERFVSRRIAILTCSIYMLLPIWHFVPVLLAESLSAFIVVALIFLLSNVNETGLSKKTIIISSALIAIGVYLKPNNLLLLAVVSGFLLVKLKVRIIRSISTIALLVVIFLSPWIYFASQVQPGFLGLTTNSGGNFYIGTGMVIAYDGSVLSKSAIKWGVDPKNNPADVLPLMLDKTPVERNLEATQSAIRIWKERPMREIRFGLDKILIAFGIKSNSLFEHVFGLFSLLSVISGIVLLRVKEFRAWGSVLLITAGLLALQAAIFQADRRFVVPVLFPFSAVCLGLTLSFFSSKISIGWRTHNSS